MAGRLAVAASTSAKVGRTSLISALRANSIAMTGGPDAALWAFLIFYVTCLVITWAVYTRKGGMLYDIERRGFAPVAQPAQ